MGQDIAEVTVGDEKIGITVNREGMFAAKYGGKSLQDNTLAGIRKQLLSLYRREVEALEIEVSIVGLTPCDPDRGMRFGDDREFFKTGIGVVHAKLRGQNQHTKELMLISEDDQKFNLSGYGGESRKVCRRISLEETKEYLRLAAALQDAKDQLETWIEVRHEDPYKLLGIKK